MIVNQGIIMEINQNQGSKYTPDCSPNWSEEQPLYIALVTSGKENRARDYSLFSWATNRTIIVEDSSMGTD